MVTDKTVQSQRKTAVVHWRSRKNKTECAIRDSCTQMIRDEIVRSQR